MKFLEFSVGSAGPGQHIKVTLSGHQAEVWLMDSVNVSKFKRGGQARGVKDFFGTSPITFAVPSQRPDWKVLVIPLGGQVSASVQTIRLAS